ncbi:MAG: phosphoribosylglycinamide formyltransferase [Gammaproteobacteria bacterium]|nr:phosphoribosylglycinamide formyltransferase [Gammaproteobacteria bacterium]
MTSTEKASVVVLISGRGSNLQALIDVSLRERQFSIAAVISNHADAYGLKRAKNAGIRAACIDYRNFPDQDSFDDALIENIDSSKPDLLVLAGFMRILTPRFVQHFQGRAINIHPSLLPKYRGLHTHQRVLDAGDKIHGCSVHFVTDELDGGPIIIQSRVPVFANDNEDTLAKRVLKNEHIIYPMVVTWYAQKRLRMRNDQIEFDGKPLTQPLILQDISDAQNPLPT